MAMMAMNGPHWPGGNLTLVGKIKGRLTVMTLEVGYCAYQYCGETEAAASGATRAGQLGLTEPGRAVFLHSQVPRHHDPTLLFVQRLLEPVHSTFMMLG